MLKDKYIPFGKRSRKHDHAWTEVEAAITLQCMYRCRKAQTKFKELVYIVWHRVYEPSEGKWFYENTNSKKCQWTKPKALNKHEDIEIPETSLEYELHKHHNEISYEW